MSWSEDEFAAFNRERGQAAFQEAKQALTKPTKGHKFRAKPCIVTPDLTLFSQQDIYNAASFKQVHVNRLQTPLKELAQASGIDGDWFGSEKEAKRYIELAGLQKVGAIRELRRQVPYALLVNGTKIADWRADFTYEEFYDGQWLNVREDTKGFRTQEFKLKCKHVEAQYGFTIRQT